MYTHAYSDYVNHILNRSPSKAAYSFTKSSRFPEPKDAPLSQPAFLAANGFEYSDGARQTPINQQERSISIKKKAQRSENRSRSKSPLQHQHQHQRSMNEHQAYKGGREEKIQVPRRPLATHNASKRSRSKSPVREVQRKRPSPTKTYHQLLEEADAPFKNRTLSGYYPTGYELSPSGKYINSQVKNSPAHSFGKSDERYQYLMKSSDELGPGYYRNFSEFGGDRR